jgi:hypothetical protein
MSYAIRMRHNLHQIPAAPRLTVKSVTAKRSAYQVGAVTAMHAKFVLGFGETGVDYEVWAPFRWDDDRWLTDLVAWPVGMPEEIWPDGECLITNYDPFKVSIEGE